MTGMRARLKSNNTVVQYIEISCVHKYGFTQSNEPDELLCYLWHKPWFSPGSWKNVNVSAIHLFLPVGSSRRN